MNRTEIRITGMGGQGVVLCGHIIGRACAIDAGKHATMIQSFGPEARGSACSTTLAVSAALNMAVFAPMPSAKARTAGTAKPGRRRRARRARRR